MPLEIKLIRDSEYTVVNDFFNNSRGINRPGGRKARKQSKFSWEFLEGPDRTVIYAGAWEVDEGKEPVLVGTQCAIIHKMISSDGTWFLAAKGEDTLVGINAIARYRNTDILKELFSVLTEACKKSGVEFLWGFNTIPATYKRIGFGKSFKTNYSVLVLNPVKAYKNILSNKPEISVSAKYKMAILAGMSYLYSFRRKLLPCRQMTYHINRETGDNTGLFQRAAVPGPLCFMLQDNAYFTWRIRNNPYPIQYRSYQLLDRDNLLQGQVICSVAGNVASIEQTLFDKELAGSVVNFFLGKVISALKNEEICMIRYTWFQPNSLNAREMQLFKSMGFVFTGKGEWFTFKKLRDNTLFNPENIYLSRLYKQGID